MKLKSINAKFLATVLIITLCSSCKKYLEEKPNASLTVPKTIAEL
jgi:hypothetical protein